MPSRKFPCLSPKWLRFCAPKASRVRVHRAITDRSARGGWHRSSPWPVRPVAKVRSARRYWLSKSRWLAYVDQGYIGEKAAEAAQERGITLEVVKLPAAKRGFVLLPRRWVIERSFAWVTRCRRLVKDYERYASTLAGLHTVAFACFMLKQAALLATSA